jgi:hypothetical protein
MRDDFSQRTIETLANRVGNRCSNPECGQVTSGPHTEDEKAVNIGVAAHITAASPGGARYDPSLSAKQRQAITNDIWLRQSCSKLVDSDESRYPIPLLKIWKKAAEDRSLHLVSGRKSEGTEPGRHTLGSHDIEFAVNGWEVTRQTGNSPGGALVFHSQWREGDILFSCKIRLRNRLAHDEDLHRLRIEFRQGEHILFSDDYAIQPDEITLPPRKWTTLEVSHGLHDRSVFDRAESVWLTALTVGDNAALAWQIAKLEGDVG